MLPDHMERMMTDVAGGCYVPCQIDLESGGKPIIYEALSARLLHRRGAEGGRPASSCPARTTV